MKEGERDLKFGNNFCDPSSGVFFFTSANSAFGDIFITVLRK
jgi:hypothetical protein